MPARGEIVTGLGDFEFEVLDADPRRIKRIKIHPLGDGAPRARPAPPPAAGVKPGESGYHAVRSASNITYLTCFIVDYELQKKEVKQLKRLSRAQN